MGSVSIHTEQVDFPVALLDIAWSESGIHSVTFATRRRRASTTAHPGFLDTAYGKAFSRYFAGELGALESLPVVLEGSAFQLKVWNALKQIAPGQTQTYGAIAERIGHPGASRAVGTANSRNPVGIVIPCHRVIGAGRRLAGYAGGIARKRWLLTHEGADFIDK
jgi:O-6-methylguanine DNA methyltransferase